MGNCCGSKYDFLLKSENELIKIPKFNFNINNKTIGRIVNIYDGGIAEAVYLNNENKLTRVSIKIHGYNYINLNQPLEIQHRGSLIGQAIKTKAFLHSLVNKKKVVFNFLYIENDKIVTKVYLSSNIDECNENNSIATYMLINGYSIQN